MESQGIPALLDMEEPTAQWPSANKSRDSRADTKDESSQSTLGRTSDSWRTSETGIDIGETTVAKYMTRPRQPSSQTWKTFLKNHMRDIVSTDFFVVPTATFRLLFVFLVLSYERRRIVHFAVTAHPTAEWTAQQLVDAFPWENAVWSIYSNASCRAALIEFEQTTQPFSTSDLSSPLS